MSPSAAEEELIGGVRGLVPVAVAQLAEELAERGLVVEGTCMPTSTRP